MVYSAITKKFAVGMLLLIPLLMSFPASAQNTVLDHFTYTQLDPSWTFTDPVGNSAYSLTANPGQLQISIPSGSSHDCWTGATNCVRLLRPAGNSDAVYETKIDGQRIGTSAQTYGILLWQDASNYIRFEYWTDGKRVIPAAWKIIGGKGSNAIFGPATTLGTSNYLRVTRTASNFKLEYSKDGIAWNTAGTFTQTFTVNQAGLVVINAVSNPATIGNFDYFIVDQSVDTTEPTVKVIHSPVNPASSEQVTFTAIANVIANITIYVDNIAGKTCMSTTTCTFIGGPYSLGAHTYYAAATFNSNIVYTITHTVDVANWLHLTSKNAEIPAPNGGLEQTATLILDIDKDGVNDFVVAERTLAPSLVWYRRGSGNWTKYIIDNTMIPIEVGGASYDIDGDGDQDIVMGGYSSNWVWWWENPYPNYGPNTPWTRHVIKSDGGNKHHDQIFGDFNGDGKAELVFWNQGSETLWSSNIPVDPKNTAPWPMTAIYTYTGTEHEGLAKADIDGDGIEDIIGGGRWFKYNGVDYTPGVIDDSQKSSRVAVGQLKIGGRPEVVFVPGEGFGRLVWYEWDGISWAGHDLLGYDVDHGHSLQVADINADGSLDIFCAEMRLNGENPDAMMWIFYGDGNGNFNLDEMASGIGNHESRVGDLDGDGDLDILGKPFNWDTPRLDVWLQNSALSLDSWYYIQVDNARSTFDGVNRYFGLAASDVNNDGYKDIISGRYFYRNPGGDMSGAWTRIILPLNVDAMLTVNVDDDDFADVIAEGLPNVYWLEAGDTQGDSWNYTLIGSIPATSHVNSQGYAIADIITGSKPEILLSSGDGIYYFEIPYYPGTGNWPRIQITGDASEEGIGVGDIDNDGKVDVIASGSNDLDIYWWKNPGDGTGNWIGYKIGTTLQPSDRKAVADINRDGRPDIVVTEETLDSGAGVYWFEQPVDPTSQNWLRYTLVTQYTTNSMDVADMDNDGDADIITGEHRGTKKVAIWENLDGASFAEHVASTGIESHLGSRVADLDGDGDFEIVSIAWDDFPSLHLWRNDARGGLTVDTTPPVISSVSAINITADSAIITWSTDEASDAQVEYGLTANYGSQTNVDTNLVTIHAQPLSGLAVNTIYHYRVNSRDAQGNLAASSDFNFTTLDQPPVLDDFTSTQLDPSWTFTDPVGNSAYSLTANPGQLQISIPSGSSHDCWTGATNCVRLLRPAGNSDAIYETKIDGQRIGTSAQTYGILLWQDASNYLRFEYWTDGKRVIPAAWKIIGGKGSNAIFGAATTLGTSNYLRVTRTGSNFKLEYSKDGIAWNSAGTFTQTFTVNQAGFVVINAVSNPATIGNFDYFSMRPK